MLSLLGFDDFMFYLMKNSDDSNPSSKSSKWSRQHDCCVNCKRTDRKHESKGLCLNCYHTQYSLDNIERVKAIKHASYLRRGGKELIKVKRELKWFDNNRETVLKRDNYKCNCCGSDQNLVVHHIDGNGRGSKNPNNNLENLKTLCRACHSREHHTLDRWSRNHSKCINCGTNEKRHNANGLCVNCYQLSQRREENPHPRIKAPEQWSFDYHCCQSCKTTSIKHKGNGLCLVCHRRDRYQRERS